MLTAPRVVGSILGQIVMYYLYLHFKNIFSSIKPPITQNISIKWPTEISERKCMLIMIIYLSFDYDKSITSVIILIELALDLQPYFTLHIIGAFAILQVLTINNLLKSK